MRQTAQRLAAVEAGAWVSPSAALRPPGWLVAATAALTLTCLAMAVAETTLWMHFLIDEGEYISLVGLAFIAAAGVHVFRKRQLLISLPLVLPWLLYPVITQGDQLIDNLTINQMRVVCHVLLALLFGAPVAVAVLAARYALAPARPRTLPRRHWTNYVPGLRPMAEGRVRLGGGLLASALFVAEIWLAHQLLGALMVITLVLMVLGVLVYATAAGDPPTPRRSAQGERLALVALIAGVMLSFGLYVTSKNRPGAYQGSPAYYMDPSQKDATYPLDHVFVPARVPAMPAPQVADRVGAALSAYARSMQELLDGYYVADRNYNHSFHNALFIRNTPVLPDFRRAALSRIAGAARVAAAADAGTGAVRPLLAAGDPLGALLDDVQAYAAFNFRRAAILERKTAEFERTQAGLQHATHIYEGEGKSLGVRLAAIIRKHHAVTDAPGLAPMTGEFLAISRTIYDKYSNRIVGF